MLTPGTTSSRPLPRWLTLGASGLIAFHLFTVVVLVLSAPSGPWPAPFGVSQAIGPPFAGQIAEVTTRYYLRPMCLTHNYHFLGNRPDVPDVFVNARLKDEAGHTLEKLEIPSTGDNPFLRYRHALLAQALAGDEPVEVPRGEVIPAPGQQMRKITVWNPTGPNTLELRQMPVHLVPRDQPVSQPSPWSLILVRSYQRYLVRRSGAAAVELVRHSRQAVMPALLFLPEPPRGTFDTLISTYEEYRRED
jgi:hypothetical protein